MKEIRSIALTSVAHLSKILLGFFVLKLIAFYRGPVGLGELGHYMSAVTFLAIFSGGGITNALVKYVSEYKLQFSRLSEFLSSTVSYSFYICIFSFLILIIFSEILSFKVFKNKDFFYLIIFLAFSQFFIASVAIVIGLFNGIGDTVSYSKIQIIGSVLALPICWYFIKYYDLPGAAIALVLIYTAPFIPAIYFMIRSGYHKKIKFLSLNFNDTKKLLAFTVMLLISALAAPITEVIIREMLIKNSGYSTAGIWQGAIKLSSAYLGFFSVFLAYYFMPKISTIQDCRLIGIEVNRMLLFVASIYLSGALIFYIFRYFFLEIILSKEFYQIADFLIFQLVGDLFRILSYVIGFVVVAKAATKIYVLAEIFQNVLFIFLIYYLSYREISLGSVMKTYAVSYFIYFTVCLILFRVYVNSRFSRKKF